MKSTLPHLYLVLIIQSDISLDYQKTISAKWNIAVKLICQEGNYFVVFEGFHGEDTCEREFAVTPCILSFRLLVAPTGKEKF